MISLFNRFTVHEKMKYNLNVEDRNEERSSNNKDKTST